MAESLMHLDAGMEEYKRLLPILDQRDRMEEAQIRGRVFLENPDIGLAVRARTHNLLCWTFIEGLRRPSPEAVLHGEEAARIARSIEDPELLLQALANLAHAYVLVSDYGRAAAAYQEMLSRLEGAEHLLPYGRTIAHVGLGYIQFLDKEWEKALEHYDTADAASQAHGSRYFKADIIRRKILVLIKQERAAEAVPLMQQISEDSIDATGRSMWWKPVFMATKGRLEFALGNFNASREIATNTLVLAKELGDSPAMAEATCLLAQIDAMEHKRDAVRRARSAVNYAIASGRRDIVDDVRERLGDVLGIVD